MKTEIKDSDIPPTDDRLFAVCDPYDRGNLVYTTVSRTIQEAIQKWIEVEQFNWPVKINPKLRKSWNDYEIEGYRVLPVILSVNWKSGSE